MRRPLLLLIVAPLVVGIATFVRAARQPAWSVYSIEGWCGTPHRTTFHEYERWRRDAAERGFTPRGHREDENETRTSFLYFESAVTAVGAAAVGLLIETLIRRRSSHPAPSPRPA